MCNEGVGDLIFIGEPRASTELEMETGETQVSWEGQSHGESGVEMALQAEQGQILKGQDWLPSGLWMPLRSGRVRGNLPNVL